MAREMKAREFTKPGIARARRFLAEVRSSPRGPPGPPEELLQGAKYTRSFKRGNLAVEVRERPFSSRREIGEYLAPRLAPFRTWIADRTSFWSWLGIFHFADTVRIVDGEARLSPLDETFVIDRGDSQNHRGIHRHYLRAAWQLYDVHGDKAAFLLEQPPTARGFIANTIFQSQRIFNSAGMVPLILGLYTSGDRPKRGFHSWPGGLRHLLRVLDQLERTHDVNGMSPEALTRILPPEFAPWVNGAAADRVAIPLYIVPQLSSAEHPSAPDPKLERWQRIARQIGRGAMRHQGFRAMVRVDAATGTLEGRIKSPHGRLTGSVSAADAAGFVEAVRRHVQDHLGRGQV